MSVTQHEVKTIIERLHCDEPGCDGEMYGDAMPPQAGRVHVHACNKCGATATMTTCYPRYFQTVDGERVNLGTVYALAFP